MKIHVGFVVKTLLAKAVFHSLFNQLFGRVIQVITKLQSPIRSAGAQRCLSIVPDKREHAASTNRTNG